MSENGSDKLAVLIDADNAQAAICPELLAEVSKFGVASVKRAYGDWTTTNLKGWKSYLHKHAIQPIQQFSYTQGKNSTDSSLIIDAMDLLHEGKLNGFCLISSDSDFTRLANRIRESGLLVYGFGEKKTPEAFVAACDKFVYTEVLKPSKDQNTKDESKNLDLNGSELLKNAMRRLNLSARAYDRILKVALTIADLEGEPRILTHHLAEAINYRNLDRESWAG